MMNSHPSSSDPYLRLHSSLQRWIWEQQWTTLRDIQELAIAAILDSQTDVIIAAATATGKTEAAFLPIFSQLIEHREDSTLPRITAAGFVRQHDEDEDESPAAAGIEVLYISPLKALINDQERRLSLLGDRLQVPIHPWHGDIDNGRKQKTLKHPSGVLLITPESLEAMFIQRGTALSRVFAALRYIVIDELHVFIGTERGQQLRSLLHRLELVLRRTIPRIGLSATLGEMQLAKEYLRWQDPESVRLIVSKATSQDLKLQLRGYRKRAFEWEASQQESSEPSEPSELSERSNWEVPEWDGSVTLDANTGSVIDAPTPSSLIEKALTDQAETDEALTDEALTDEADDAIAIAQHLFKVLRGDKNLIFINRRQEVEQYADLLSQLCLKSHLPNEFLPHHGSLSKELREAAEEALKERDRPANVICTSTLELGIDIGAVTSIAQIGAPYSVASTRQRLGRSGRKQTDPAVMRLYVSEPDITPTSSPEDALHPEIMQAIAILNLLLKGWYEPPVVGKLHLSTLIQQLLSLIAQYSGIRPDLCWKTLCQTGAFPNVDQRMFMDLLRCLGQADLIQQSQEGLLLLGLKGERLVNHYSFYTAFKTAEEYRIMTSGQFLGSLPIDFPLFEDMYLIFAAKRWQVLAVDSTQKIVEVASASVGRVPQFGGDAGIVHDRIRQEMRQLYTTPEVPSFLDPIARGLLTEARRYFELYQLNRSALLQNGQQVLLFPWCGSVVMNTLMVLLLAKGLRVERAAIALILEDAKVAQVRRVLQGMAIAPPIDPIVLADTVANKVTEKHDVFLHEALLNQNYASSSLDVVGAWRVIGEVVGRGGVNSKCKM
jgi:ATP-dependent helicase Lhr and Lhr-like helicase